MLKFIKISSLFIALTFAGGSLAIAADQDKKRDRKKDGSCQTDVIVSDTGLVLAADQDRKRDRKKDGSCQVEAMI
jgi:hypothetical protein